MTNVEKQIKAFSAKLDELGSVLRIDELRKTLEEKELLMNAPDFWKDQNKAKQISQEVAALKEQIDAWEGMKQELLKPRQLFARQIKYRTLPPAARRCLGAR